MIEFSDLNEDICADSWLIKNSEISKRKLVRQTPRYNIYKADWFGDVLVYEPVSSKPPDNRLIERCRQIDDCRPQFNRIGQLSARLAELNLSSIRSNRSNRSNYERPPSGGSLAGSCSGSSSIISDDDAYCSSGEQTDSAYSSISSTPQYNTKNNVKSEFEFSASRCSELAGSPSGSSAELASEEEEKVEKSVTVSPLEVSEAKLEQRKQRSNSARPLVLNNKSYRTGGQLGGGSICNDEACWSNERLVELNELRLVAHESFMLFMGFSIGEQQQASQERAVSLVMQINHPRAISLYNLLHQVNNLQTPTSPLDRFFSTTARTRTTTTTANQQQQQLSLPAKLNICQQVTNAMTYLHDKNIVHARLTSVNIYIELNQRVKISLIDNDEQALASEQQQQQQQQQQIDAENKQNPGLNSATAAIRFNLPALTYLSPELIRTIKTNHRRHDGASSYSSSSSSSTLIDSAKLSKKSDIFSFGTLLFELFAERFPFAGNLTPTCLNDLPNLSPSYYEQYHQHQQLLLASSTPLGFATNFPQITGNHNIRLSASELIYQIGSGKIEARNLHCNRELASSSHLTLVKHIIAACWLEDPSKRPNFAQLSFVDQNDELCFRRQNQHCY